MEKLPDILQIVLASKQDSTVKYLQVVGSWNTLTLEGLSYTERLDKVAAQYSYEPETVRQIIYLIKKQSPEILLTS